MMRPEATPARRNAAAAALRAVAARAERDTRGPKLAVQAVWTGLHGEVYARDEPPYWGLRIAFEALGVQCGITDVIGYLGPALRRLTAAERAGALRAAAEAIDGPS